MKVLFVNTSDNIGGAAVATNRLVKALRRQGVDATLLVRDKTTGWPEVSTTKSPNAVGQWGIGSRGLGSRWAFLFERLSVLLHLGMKREHLWEIDMADFGEEILSLKEFREADIIHLAWINQGMLSLDAIRRIVDTGKPIVWTMHDLWPVSGICHYSRGCERFIDGCGKCQFVNNTTKKDNTTRRDFSKRVWLRKKAIYKKSDIHFVACSQWLEGQARQSGLTAGLSVQAIPNTINTNVFKPHDKAEARKALGLPQDKKVILFVSQKLTDARKGAGSLVKAINKFRYYYPKTADNCCVALLGSHSEEIAPYIGLPTVELGYISGDENIAQVYSAADLFVLPSTEDNLPNTIMEALACGVPCVGFNVGGIPEMIDHKENGFVVQLGNSAEMADGMHWILENEDEVPLQENCLKKVRTHYSEESVCARYIALYDSIVHPKVM